MAEKSTMPRKPTLLGGFPFAMASFVRQIYILILGIGISLFVSSPHSEFSRQLFDKGHLSIIYLAYFLSLYFFLAYDWLAYAFLVEDAPYVSIQRFCCDLIALLVKSCLIYLSTTEITAIHTFLLAVLFLIWHVIVTAWHRFSGWEYSTKRPEFRSHLLMALIYGVYALLVYYLKILYGWQFIEQSIYIWTLIICTIIVSRSLLRLRYFLALAKEES